MNCLQVARSPASINTGTMSSRSQRGTRKRAPALRPVPSDVARDSLAHGGVVLAPTESVFGLAVDARSEAALKTLWTIKNTSPQPLAWHISRVRDLTDQLEAVKFSLSSVQRRIGERLAPGPLLLAIELDETQLAHIHKALAVAPGIVDDGAHLLVRIVGHPACQSLIDAFDGPIAMASLPEKATVRDFVGATQVLHHVGMLERITAGIDGLPAPKGMGSTAVTFAKDGSFAVTREGVYERRFVEKHARQLVLFVCSGNTCRSPMAEAIARQLIKEAGADIEVGSAGMFASAGNPATPEAVHAVRALGVPMPRHESRSASRELLHRADVIFAMTEAHADAARRYDPDSIAQVHQLDATGRDVDDPIGQPQSVYDTTASRLRTMIEQRLLEFGLLPAPASGGKR